MTAKPLTADQAASLRPQASPILDLFAQDCAGAILRLVRLHASRNETELRVRVDPELVDRVQVLLYEARYRTVTLKRDSEPTGRLIVRWPASPEFPGRKGLPPTGPPRQQQDQPEFVWRLIALLYALGLRTADHFQDVAPYPLLYERTRDLVAAQRPQITSPD